MRDLSSWILISMVFFKGRTCAGAASCLLQHSCICASPIEVLKWSVILYRRQLQVCSGQSSLQGDVKKLVDDVGAFKPSLFVAVPRVLDRMKSGIQAKVARSGPIASTIFKLAVWYKRIWIKLGFLNNVRFFKCLTLQLCFCPVSQEIASVLSVVQMFSGSRWPSLRI